MSFCINDKKLLHKYKTIWIKVEIIFLKNIYKDLKNIELNVLPVYDDRKKIK